MKTAMAALLTAGQSKLLRGGQEQSDSGKRESLAPGVKFHCSDLERTVAYFVKGTAGHQVWLSPGWSVGWAKRSSAVQGCRRARNGPCSVLCQYPCLLAICWLLRPGRLWAQSSHTGPSILECGCFKVGEERAVGDRRLKESWSSSPSHLRHTFSLSHSDS